MTDIRYLSGNDLRGLATPGEFVDVVREAYHDRGTGGSAAPRTKLLSKSPPGMFTTYAAVLPTLGYMGGYMYSAGFGARDATFVTPLFDAESGDLLAILDGAYMNPLKTGAAGAVGVDALARNDASVLGVIGAGTQARGQIRATVNVRDISDVLIFSPTAENRESLASELDQELTSAVRAVEGTEEILAEADVIVTATTASEPVFDGSGLRPGTHVTAMGQYDPEKRELDSESIAKAIYVPDLRERVMQDAGSFIHAVDSGVVTEEHVHGELGDVLAGSSPGRTSENDITVFDSGGTGIETVAAAGLLYERACDADRGTMLELLPASESFP